MRKLYEINQDIENLINAVTDPDTGEVTDTDALDDLYLERDQKIESVVLYCKDISQEYFAIANEIERLVQRRDRLKNTLDSLRGYLARALDGQKFSTPKCEVIFRKSEAVEVDDDFMEWAADNFAVHFIKRKETVTPDKIAIKKFLKDGGNLEHCRLVEKKNISIT